MVRKCREIAVMEVSQAGVRTRSRSALAMASTNSETSKKRKVDSSELNFSPSCIQLHSRVLNTPENTVSPSPVPERSLSKSTTTTATDLCSSHSLDHVLASCCSSNGSSQLAEEEIKFVDLKDEDGDEVETSTHHCCSQRRETSSSTETEDMNSTAAVRQSEENSRRKSKAEKMPTESELEEFFSAAESVLQKSFADKYNYDIVNDKPLEGRFDWIRLN